jgi:uncharacterized protein YndB with AHSA1/START domain
MWITRWLPVPAETVYDAWLDPTMMQQWFTVEGGAAAGVCVDPRPSGTFAVVERRGSVEVGHCGTYREMWRPHRLVFSWQAPAHFDGESLVTVSIVPLENETLLTVGVEGPGQPQTEAMWHRRLDRLRAALGSSKSEAGRGQPASSPDLPIQAQAEDVVRSTVGAIGQQEGAGSLTSWA